MASLRCRIPGASPPWSRSCPRSSCSPTGKSEGLSLHLLRDAGRKNKWYARRPTVAPWAFLRSPSPASPSLFFLRRSVFRPFYFITIMYTLFESENADSTALSPEIAICHWWRLMVESLLQKCFGRSLPVGEPCDQDGYSEALKISCRQGTTGGRQNCSLWESIPAPP